MYQYERLAAFRANRCYHAAPMNPVVDRIRTRIVPATLTALGVAFLAGGLLSFSNPVTADPTDSAAPSPTPVAVVATPSPLITLPPIESAPPPSASPPIAGVPADRVATRVRIAALKIDLPIIRADGGYPACNVAMWYNDRRLGQPGEGKATYLFAHARTGMFLPLLNASKQQNGKKMLGMVVELWTNDDQRFLYVITDVRRHVPTTSAFNAPFNATTEQLWLQTSEGVGPMPKLQIVAEPLSQETVPHAEANPVPKPVNCR
jgi:hypothetical protein